MSIIQEALRKAQRDRETAPKGAEKKAWVDKASMGSSVERKPSRKGLKIGLVIVTMFVAAAAGGYTYTKWKEAPKTDETVIAAKKTDDKTAMVTKAVPEDKPEGGDSKDESVQRGLARKVIQSPPDRRARRTDLISRSGEQGEQQPDRPQSIRPEDRVRRRVASRAADTGGPKAEAAPFSGSEQGLDAQPNPPSGPADTTSLKNMIVKTPDQNVAADETYQTALNEAKRLQSIGELKSSETLYKSLIRQSPLKTDALINLANMYFRDYNEPDKAIILYERALELDPNKPSIHVNLGVYYLKEKELDKAYGHLSRALKLNDRLVEVHYNLACLHAIRGERQQAVESLKRAIELDPRSAEWARSDPDLASISFPPTNQKDKTS